MRSPSLIRTEARRSYKQAHARSNTTSSDNEMTLLATALAQRDQPLVVLAPGQTDGVDTLLAWLVREHQISDAWELPDFPCTG